MLQNRAGTDGFTTPPPLTVASGGVLRGGNAAAAFAAGEARPEGGISAIALDPLGSVLLGPALARAATTMAGALDGETDFKPELDTDFDCESDTDFCPESDTDCAVVAVVVVVAAGSSSPPTPPGDREGPPLLRSLFAAAPSAFAVASALPLKMFSFDMNRSTPQESRPPRPPSPPASFFAD